MKRMNIYSDFDGCYGRDGGDDRFTRFMISNADREKFWSKVASISPNAAGHPVQRCHATDGQLGDGQPKPARPKWPHSEPSLANALSLAMQLVVKLARVASIFAASRWLASEGKLVHI